MRKPAIFNMPHSLENRRHIRILAYLLYAIPVAIGIFFLFNRLRFGVELTDESWYVAESYIVSQGAVPFVNNWSQAPGFTLPLAFIFKMYTAIHGTEGIFLFSRIIYACWLIIVSFVSIYILGKYLPGTTPFIAIFPLIFIAPYSLFDINYNTIGVVYLLLVLVLMIFPQEDQCTGKYHTFSVVAGLIIARAIIGTPYILMAWIILLALCAKTKQWKKLYSFIAGNTVMAVIVVGWCCISGGGVGNFIKGLFAWLHDCMYFKIPARHSFIGDVLYLVYFCIPFLICFIVTQAIRKSFSQNNNVFYGVVIAFIICGLCLAFFVGPTYKNIVKYLWFVPFIIYFGDKLQEKRELVRNICIFNAIYFAVFLFSSSCNVYGFSSREYWLCVPSIFSVLLINYMIHNRVAAYGVLYVGSLVLGVLFITYVYGYVYRDQTIELLDTKVDYGAYKGCYTTAARAEAVKELEQYLRSVTEADDNILFLDQVPFAYVMTEANACTPNSADPMSHSYGVNSPEAMYDYFALSGRVPNKIIYIDFGRDELLSIDDEWRFNEFLDTNYILSDIFMTANAVENRYEVSDSEKASFLVKCYEVIDEDITMNGLDSFLNGR